eukprot:1146340-Pelagomonas_calceolata.AAC.7
MELVGQGSALENLFSFAVLTASLPCPKLCSKACWLTHHQGHFPHTASMLHTAVASASPSLRWMAAHLSNEGSLALIHGTLHLRGGNVHSAGPGCTGVLVEQRAANEAEEGAIAWRVTITCRDRRGLLLDMASALAKLPITVQVGCPSVCITVQMDWQQRPPGVFTACLIACLLACLLTAFASFAPES